MEFRVSRIAERSAAICELLATPDPPELRRAHVARLDGKPERFALISQLTGVFVHSKLLALEEIRRAKRADGEPLRFSSATRHQAGLHCITALEAKRARAGSYLLAALASLRCATPGRTVIRARWS